MSIQISVDPAGLSQEQREAVAGFILAFPGKACSHAVAEIHVHTANDDMQLQEAFAKHGIAPEIAARLPAVNELEALQHDHESTLPVAAFGQPVVDEATAAFGVPAAPLAVSTPAIAAASTVAPPPPVNTAPITTTLGGASSAAGVSSAGVELDKHGLPWDGRIHAGTKRKNADGSWTAKRGVDPALVAQVEAELRQVMGAAPLAPAAVIPAQPAANVTTPTPSVASSAAVAPVPPIAPQPPAPSVPPAPAGEVPQDARQQFVSLVGRASAAIQAGKVSQAEVNQICADSGIPALPLLANRLDLVATVASRIDTLIAARGQ